jgi:hypothetical protein
VFGWLVAAGYPPDRAGILLSNVRHSVRNAVAAGTVPADTRVWARRVGHVRRGAGEWTRDPEATLAARFPTLHDELIRWLAHAASKDVPPSVVERKRKAVRWLGVALDTLDAAGDLATLGRFAPGDLPASQIGTADLGLARVHRAVTRALVRSSYGFRDASDQTSTQEVPLVEVVGEHLLAAHPARGRRQAAGEVSPSNLNALRDVWDVALVVGRPDVVGDGKNPHRVAAWAAADALVREWMKPRAVSTNAPGLSCRNKSLLTDNLVLSELVVYGLPWLTEVRLPALRDDVQHRVAAGQSPRQVAQARAAYAEALREWMVLAQATADPLRIANLAFGRVGTGHTDATPCEIEVQALWHDHGLLAEVKGVTTRYKGRRFHWPCNRRGAIKQRNHPGREWDWSPSLVDPRWFGEYLREVWWPGVQEAARLNSRPVPATMRGAMAERRWTLYPSPRRNRHPWCGLGDDKLTAVWGEAALRVMREALGRPVRSAGIGAARWLGPTPSRSTTFGTSGPRGRRPRGPPDAPAQGRRRDRGVGDVAAAGAAGDDGHPGTLKRHYETVTDSVSRRRQKRVASWEHPTRWRTARPGPRARCAHQLDGGVAAALRGGPEAPAGTGAPWYVEHWPSTRRAAAGHARPPNAARRRRARPARSRPPGGGASPFRGHVAGLLASARTLGHHLFARDLMPPASPLPPDSAALAGRCGLPADRIWYSALPAVFGLSRDVLDRLLGRGKPVLWSRDGVGRRVRRTALTPDEARALDALRRYWEDALDMQAAPATAAPCAERIHCSRAAVEREVARRVPRGPNAARFAAVSPPS